MSRAWSHQWHQHAKLDKPQFLHKELGRICSVQRVQESEQLAIGCGSNSGQHGEGCQSVRVRRSGGNLKLLSWIMMLLYLVLFLLWIRIGHTSYIYVAVLCKRFCEVFKFFDIMGLVTVRF